MRAFNIMLEGWVSGVIWLSCVLIRDLRVWKCLWHVAFRECDDCVFSYPAAECALKLLCAFGKGTAGRDQWNGGRRRRNLGCCLSIHAFLPCSSPPSLRERVCVKERERECVCQSGGTAGVGQSVNAADSNRRFPGYQPRKAPGGFFLSASLLLQSRSCWIC